jgi:cytoskeletal protein CcmA (bactofilin family)
VRGEVAIAAAASWAGDIEAERAVIAGTVRGNLVVSDTLEVSASAHIHGQLTARRIAIARGAQILGEIRCTGSEPVIEFEERRAALA